MPTSINKKHLHIHCLFIRGAADQQSSETGKAKLINLFAKTWPIYSDPSSSPAAFASEVFGFEIVMEGVK
jgi:hypothetical protein